MKENRLFCVIPCYNEQEVLPETSKRLKLKMQQLITDGKISPDSRVVFLKDGEIVLHQSTEDLRLERKQSIDEAFREVFRC